jgi:hypothetical protein
MNILTFLLTAILMSKESTGLNSSRLNQLLTLVDTLEATSASSILSLLSYRPLLLF